MKRLLICAVLMIISVCGFAQNTGQTVNHVIYFDVPEKRFKLEDNIYLVNKSQYFILQATVSIPKSGIVLGRAMNVAPGGRVEMVCYDRNWLKTLQGKRIAVKVKGLKKMPENTKMTEEEIRAIDPKEITRDFAATFDEDDHDLFITILNNMGRDMDD